MSDSNEIPSDSALVAYEIYAKDIDSYMWDFNFRELPKCSECGLRLDFFVTKPDYRLGRSGPDLGTTWDHATIATKRFRDFIEAQCIDGLEFGPFRRDPDHFALFASRVVSVDLERSRFEIYDVCKKCRTPQYVLTRGRPMLLEIQEPLRRGFYRSNLLFGHDNRKSPALIVDPHTMHLLEQSGLSGIHHVDPVYAASTPALEAALKSYPVRATTPKRSRKKPPTPPQALDLKPYIKLLSQSEAAFRCRAAGAKKESTVIPITHNIADPPNNEDLKTARDRLGRSGKQVLDFYKHSDGVELYRDRNSETAGVRLFPIKEWAKETVAMKEVFKGMRKDERPEIIDRAVAIGEVPGSSHHFLLVTKGAGAGSILLTSHESLSADEFAPDFSTFLQTVCTDPANLLTDTLGGYARYHDGKTNKEWIPFEYLPEAKLKGSRPRRS